MYQIGVKKLRINRAIKVGAVPKFLAVTPDNRLLLVSNWCSYDVSVVAVQAREIKRLPIGAYPARDRGRPEGRGGVRSRDGLDDIAVIDLQSLKLRWLRGVGAGLATS